MLRFGVQNDTDSYAHTHAESVVIMVLRCVLLPLPSASPGASPTRTTYLLMDSVSRIVIWARGVWVWGAWAPSMSDGRVVAPDC